MIRWIEVHNISQVEEIKSRSKSIPCVLFKHSTRCSISSLAKYRLEDQWEFPEKTAECFFLDLLSHREVSNYIAETFQVHHESPQVLVIREEECIYDVSHLDITVSDIREYLQASF